MVAAVLLAGMTTACGADNSADGLPRLQEQRSYPIPSNKFTGTIAEPFTGDIPTAVAWSPSGQRIAAFSSYGQNLTVWKPDGTIVTVLHPVISYLNNSLVFLDDDKLLTPPANSRTDPARMHFAFDIWSIQSGDVIQSVDGPEPEPAPPVQKWGPNLPVAYTLSHDRSMVASLAGETGRAKMGPAQEFGENPVPIYSTKTWQIIARLPVVWPASVAFSPDDKEIAFGTRTGKIIVYNTSSWQIVQSIAVCDRSTDILTLAYSPDGKLIAAGLQGHSPNFKDYAAQIFRIADGSIIGTYKDWKAAEPWAMAWDPGGRFIVFSTHDKTLRLWNPNKPDDLGRTVSGVNAMCLAFSPNGTQLASCSNGKITVFKIQQ